MSTQPIDLTPFRPHLDLEPTADILKRCLACTPELPEHHEPMDAMPWDATSRRIERLKMSRPCAAAAEGTAWLQERLLAVEHAPQDAETIGLFASALSTWGGLQRTVGQLGDAVLATHHALRILASQPVSTRAGFALQRAAYVLGDLGDVEHGLTAMQQAVEIHRATPQGQTNTGIALSGLGAYRLFYRRAFSEARAAFTMALHALPNDDEVPARRCQPRRGLQLSFGRAIRRRPRKSPGPASAGARAGHRPGAASHLARGRDRSGGR